MCMKAIQITFDDQLLRALDADEEVKRLGRSAVLRKAATQYLRRSAAARIRDQYRCAYGDRKGLGADFDGWTEQGVWPDE
jgi:metal-responsive CopG/Arc/MetJ family transcriptional regulator